MSELNGLNSFDGEKFVSGWAKQLKVDYQSGYPSYAKDMLIGSFSSEEGIEKRKLYLENIARLDISLANKVDEKTININKEEKKWDVRDVLSVIDDALHEISPRKNRFTGLTNHLKEVTDFSKDLFLDENNISKFPKLFTDGEASTIVDLVSPAHDLLKFLSKPEGQIMPDHEVVTSYMLRKHFGNIPGLEEKVEFAVEVIGDHENIFREEGRQDYIFSNNPSKRAKAVFFVADVLTGVIDFKEEVGVVDGKALNERFTDLCFRHIDLDKGKVFRPEWGLFAIRDIITTLSELEDQGLNIEEGWKEQISMGALKAVDMAKRGDSVFSRDQKSRVAVAELKLEWVVGDTEGNVEMLTYLLGNAYPDRWGGVPKNTIARELRGYKGDVDSFCTHLDDLKTELGLAAFENVSKGRSIEDVWKNDKYLEAQLMSVFDAPDSMVAQDLIGEFPLLRLLIEYVPDEQLVTQDYGLSGGFEFGKYEESLFQKAVVRMTESFRHIALNSKDSFVFENEQLTNVLYVTMLHLDVSKGGTPELREYFERRKGLDFLAHNKASAMLLQEEKPIMISILREFEGVLEDKQKKTLHDLMIRMVEYHGLSGQHIRGEVTKYAFEGLTDWVWENQEKLNNLIDTLFLKKTPTRSEFVSEIFHLVNVIDTRSVRDGLLTTELLGKFKEFRLQMNKVLSPIEGGMAPSWREMMNEKKSVYFEGMDIITDVDKKRVLLADRLVRLRGGRDGDEALGTMLELSENEVEKIHSLMERSQFWYVENATSYLSVENQLKTLVMFSAQARKQNTKMSENIDLNLAPLMNEILYRGVVNKAVGRVLDVYLYGISIEDILEGRVENGLGYPMQIPLGGEKNKSFLEINIDKLSPGDDNSFSMGLRLDETVRQALKTIDSYYKSNNRGDVEVISSAIEILGSGLGLKLDEWDRLFDQELYMETMKSSMERKFGSIMGIVESHAKEKGRGLKILGIGSGTGDLEQALVMSLDDSHEVIASDISRVMVEHEKRMSRVIKAQNFMSRMKNEGGRASLSVVQLNAVESEIPEVDIVTLYSVAHELASYVDDAEYGETVRRVMGNVLKSVAKREGKLVMRDFILPEVGVDGKVEIEFGVPKEGEEDPVRFFKRFTKEFFGFTDDEKREIDSLEREINSLKIGDKLSLSTGLAYEVYGHYSWLKDGKNQMEMSERYGYFDKEGITKWFNELAEEMDLKIEIDVKILPGGYSKYNKHVMRLDVEELINMGVVTVSVKKNEL